VEKEFQRWNDFKQVVDRNDRQFTFHEREIWWCSIGVNVGREQQSQTGDFSRPVLIIKRFTPDIFWGIPLTTKVRDVGFRVRFKIGEVENDALVFQMRSYDKKHLVRKIGTLPGTDFKKIVDLIVSAVFIPNEIPLAGEISEAEAECVPLF
jgi:mRNA interferase MazF